jgi:ankyrin repeat protein
MNPNYSNPDENKTTLHLSIERGDLDTAKILISNEVRLGEKYLLNAQDKNYKTPLHLSVERDYDEIAELLISCGVDLDVQDDEGKTALHIALEKENIHISELIIESGAFLNIEDKNGITQYDLGVALLEKDMSLLKTRILKYFKT